MSQANLQRDLTALTQSHQELSELLEVQEQEIAVLRELTLRLLQSLHVKGVVSIEEIAGSAEMGAKAEVDGPDSHRHAMLPAVVRLLRQASAELNSRSGSPGSAGSSE